MNDVRSRRLRGKAVVADPARGRSAAEAGALLREGAGAITTDVTGASGCRRVDITSERDRTYLTRSRKPSTRRVTCCAACSS